MDQARPRGLQDDRISDVLRGRGQRVDVGDEPAPRDPDPVRVEDVERFRIAEPRASLVLCTPENSGGPLPIDREGPRFPVLARPVFRVPVHPAEGAGRALREEVRRHAVLHELREPRTLLGASEEVAEDRLPTLRRRLPDRARDLDFVDSNRRHVDGDRGVDGVVAEDRVECPPIVVEARLGRQVDRIPKRGLRGRPRAHELDRPRVEFCEAKALCHEFVDAHDRRPSGVRDDGDPVSAREGL